MKIKIATLITLVAYGCSSFVASSQYRMTFPEPIECMDTDRVLGQNAFGYYNLSDTDGSFVLQIGYQYQEAYRFEPVTGLARVMSNGKYGFINVTNYPVVKAIYDDAKDFTESGYAMVCLNGKWGLVDSSGLSAIPCVYDTMSDMFNGWYEVSRDDIWGYISNKGIYAATYQEYEQKQRVTQVP